MAFRKIEILSIDTGNIERIPEARNAVLVPFALSGAPTDEWVHYFVSRADSQAAAKVVGDRAYYRCTQNKATIKGECQKRVADLVEGANRHCSELAAQAEQKRAKEREEERQREREREEFERWKNEPWD